MKKLQTLKGFRDFLPKDAKKREWLRKTMIEVFESWGYMPIETPTLEYLKLFKGQIGEDEKLFYQFKDLGGRNVALRYDQTVPTCRFIGNHFNELVFPFRRYQIQPVFRADKPQKGRYREFIHSDIDIFGIRSPIADAEIIAVALDLYKKLGFKKITVKINNRELMKDIPYSVIAAVDKIEKIGEKGVIKELKQKGIQETEIKDYLKKIKSLKPDQTIKTIFDYLDKAGFSSDNYQFIPTLARAFSYSQGPIWEFVIPEYEHGSVGGGERYDDLVKKISGQNTAGTGMGIGFERTLEAAEALGLIPELQTAPKVLISIFDKKYLKKSLQTAKILRSKNISVEIYPKLDKSLTDQLSYADKAEIKFLIIIGPDEIKKKKVTLKNMKNGDQKTITLEKAARQIKNEKKN